MSELSTLAERKTEETGKTFIDDIYGSLNKDDAYPYKYNLDNTKYDNIKEDNETKSLVTVRERRLMAAQTMFKRSIRISIKAFLLSLSLTFLNFFL